MDEYVHYELQDGSGQRVSTKTYSRESLARLTADIFIEWREKAEMLGADASLEAFLSARHMVEVIERPISYTDKLLLISEALPKENAQ